MMKRPDPAARGINTIFHAFIVAYYLIILLLHCRSVLRLKIPIQRIKRSTQLFKFENITNLCIL